MLALYSKNIADRNGIVGRHQAVAGVEIRGSGGRVAAHLRSDGQRYLLGLAIGAKCRLGHGVCRRGIANDVNPIVQSRFHIKRPHGAPATFIGQTCIARDRRCALRRNDAGQISVYDIAAGQMHLALSRIHSDDFAAACAGNPFHSSGVERVPPQFEQRALAEIVLGVGHDDLAAALRRRQPPGHQAGALVRSGRAAVGIGRSAHQ